MSKLGRLITYDHVVVTLDPTKFAEKKQRPLHIGNLRDFLAYISLLKHSGRVICHEPQRMAYDSTRKTVTGRPPSYPPDTKAFLYYSTSPEKPRIAGELRLRVVSSDDPASFESGSDLLLTNGQTWSRPLYIISKLYFLLYEKLREDQLIPDDLDTVLSTLPSKYPKYRRSQLLYTLNDTFILDFSYDRCNFLVITEQGLYRLRFLSPFSERRNEVEVTPYTGSALVRFGRSTLPEHKGTTTVVLRILKIITPVKCVIPLYDGYICCPMEGELHQRGLNQSVWSIDIGTGRPQKRGGPTLRCLQMLWDA